MVFVFHSILRAVMQDFFGKSDPYLEFYKQTATGWQLAHRTEVKTLRQTSVPVHQADL